MRKIAVFVVAFVAFTGLAIAGDYPFEASVIQTGGDIGVPVFQRYYTTVKADVNPNCAGTCPTQPCNQQGALAYCQLTYTAKNAGGYRGYTENLFNFGDAEGGTVFQSVFDAEKNTGAGNHQGFYAWVAGPVVVGGQSLWNAASNDCAGTNLVTCFGVSNTALAKDQTEVPSTAGGPTLAKIGGLSPIPIPKAVGGAPAGTFRLRWDAVSSVGKGTPIPAAGYDIYVAKAANCATPAIESQFTFVKTATQTTADVTQAEAGVAPGEQAGVTFALRLRYGTTSSNVAIVSRYLSANGQCFLTGGLAANIYEFAARHASKNNVEVSWKTSLEDGVRGFYISRATTQSGSYSRVSDLILAKGEASAYTYIDSIQPPVGNVKATGLWYKVETIDIDDNAVEYGPTKAQLPKQGNSIIKQRTAKTQR